MSPFHNEHDYRRRAYLYTFGMLMLLGLVACGSSDQAADANPVTPALPQQAPAEPPSDPPSAAQAPTSPARPTTQLPTPALRPRPTAPPAPPKPIKPSVGPVVSPVAAGGWPSYRSAQDGWSIAYPPDWTIDEQAGDDGPAITSVRPASGAGISIVVQAGAPPAIRPSEKANSICTRVTVGRLSGNRCVDTNKGTIATTLAGQGRTYVIATTGKDVDEQIYQRVLESFVAG